MSLALPLTSRRDFLKTAATASLLPLPAFVPSTALAAPDRTGANGKIRVGLIGAGNRAKWLSRCMARESAVRLESRKGLACYGSTIYTTSHLDRMAAEGIRFNTAYATLREPIINERKTN